MPKLVRTAFKSRSALVIENVALRQQLAVFKAKKPRPKLTPQDRVFWVILLRTWPKWSEALIIVKPETVAGWHRAGFRLFWRWKSRNGKPGHPRIVPEVRQIVHFAVTQNPKSTWVVQQLREAFP